MKFTEQHFHKVSPTTASSNQQSRPSNLTKVHLPTRSISSFSEASSSSPPSPRPPPFSSLYFPTNVELDRITSIVTGNPPASPLLAAPAPSFEEALAEDVVGSKAPTATTTALPSQDTKGESSSGKAAADDSEPPPPYTEGSSPLDSFAYVMSAAGGAASIITQVQQTGPPVNTLGGMIGKSCLRSLTETN